MTAVPDPISVVLTKHGRPVASLVPADRGWAGELVGSVRLVAEEDEAFYSTGAAWGASGQMR